MTRRTLKQRLERLEVVAEEEEPLVIYLDCIDSSNSGNPPERYCALISGVMTKSGKTVSGTGMIHREADETAEAFEARIMDSLRRKKAEIATVELHG